MGYEQSIITVDDSSTMRRIIKNTLQKLGFETRSRKWCRSSGSHV